MKFPPVKITTFTLFRGLVTGVFSYRGQGNDNIDQGCISIICNMSCVNYFRKKGN